MKKIISPLIHAIMGLVERIEELESENRLLRTHSIQQDNYSEQPTSDLEEFSRQVPLGSKVQPIKSVKGKHSEHLQEALAELNRHRIGRDTDE